MPVSGVKVLVTGRKAQSEPVAVRTGNVNPTQEPATDFCATRDASNAVTVPLLDTSPATFWLLVSEIRRTENFAIAVASAAVIAAWHEASSTERSDCGVSVTFPASSGKSYCPKASVTSVAKGWPVLSRRTVSPGTGFVLGSDDVTELR